MENLAIDIYISDNELDIESTQKKKKKKIPRRLSRESGQSCPTTVF